MPESGDETTEALRAQVDALSDEIAHLRARLADAPKRVRALEERLLETKGQLAQAVAQNEKLSYTLREAREHIATLRDEVDKLTQPPSAYGVIVGKNDDGTVDILTSGRKMKVATHPDIDLDELDRGSEVVLNESFNVVLARRPELDRRGRVDQGGHGGRRAGARRRPRRRGAGLRARRRRPRHPPAPRRHDAPRPALEPAAREAAPAGGRGPAARGGAGHLLQRHRRARRPDRADRRRRRAAVPAPGPVRRAPPAGAEGDPAVRPARVRQDADRQGGRQQPGQEGRRVDRRREGPQLLHQHQGPRAAQQVRRRDRAPDPPRVPAGAGEERGGLAGHRLLRRDGLDVPHPRLGHQLGHGVDDRAPAARRDRRRRGPAQRHRDRGDQPRGPHRPGDPATRPARREDQDRAAQRRRGDADLRPVPHRRDPDRRRARRCPR